MRNITLQLINKRQKLIVNEETPLGEFLFVYSEKNESEIKGIEVEIIMVEGENTTKLKYNSLKTNKVSALLFFEVSYHIELLQFLQKII